MNEGLRLFVAIHPPEAFRRAALRELDRLRPPPDPHHRRTPLDQVHLTVHFVGQVKASDVRAIEESVERATGGLEPFVLTPRRVISLPERGSPRLLALETDAPATLTELHRRLVWRLAREPRADREQRFRPHLTLCRFTGSARPARLEQAVRLEGFEVREIVLFRSVLTSAGAVHTPLLHVPLAGNGGTSGRP